MSEPDDHTTPDAGGTAGDGAAGGGWVLDEDGLPALAPLDASDDEQARAVHARMVARHGAPALEDYRRTYQQSGVEWPGDDEVRRRHFVAGNPDLPPRFVDPEASLPPLASPDADDDERGRAIAARLAARYGAPTLEHYRRAYAGFGADWPGDEEIRRRHHVAD